MYASDAEAKDILLIGELAAELSNGREAELPFCARIVAEETPQGPRMKLYQVWAVSHSRKSWKNYSLDTWSCRVQC